MDERGPARRGELGLSLLEVLVGLFLLSTVLVGVSAALVTGFRSNESNEGSSKMATAVIAYGEIIRSKVPYRACSLSSAADYESDARGFLTDTGAAGESTKWRKPDGISVSVVSVRSAAVAVGGFSPGCEIPDPGAQLVTIKVGWGAGSRTAEFVKWNPGPS